MKINVGSHGSAGLPLAERPQASRNFVRRTERITAGRIREALDNEKARTPTLPSRKPRFEAGFFRLVPLSAAESYAE